MNSNLRMSFFWDVGSLLPTFRDSLSVPSSRFKQPKKDEMSPEMFSPFRKVSTRSGAPLIPRRVSGAVPPLPSYALMAWTERYTIHCVFFFLILFLHCLFFFTFYHLPNGPPLPWRSWPCSHVLFV